MDVKSALNVTADEAAWSPAKIAAEAGVSETSARKWLAGSAVPEGETLLRLMTVMPGLAQRLGFAILKRAA